MEKVEAGKCKSNSYTTVTVLQGRIWRPWKRWGWLCLKMIDLISLAHCFWCTSLGDEMPKHPSYLHEFWCLQRHFRSIRKISSQNRPIWGICSLWKLTIIHPYDSVNGMVLLFWWYSMSYDIPRINHQPTTTTTAEWSSFQGWHMLGPVSNPPFKNSWVANVGFSQITVVFFFVGWHIGMDPNLDNKKRGKNILEGDRSPFATCFFGKKSATNQPQSAEKKQIKHACNLVEAPSMALPGCLQFATWWNWWVNEICKVMIILDGGFKYIFFMFIPIWGRFPFWRAYFSIGWFNHHLWNFANVFFGVIISEWLLYLVVELGGLLFERESQYESYQNKALSWGKNAWNGIARTNLNRQLWANIFERWKLWEKRNRKRKTCLGGLRKPYHRVEFWGTFTSHLLRHIDLEIGWTCLDHVTRFAEKVSMASNSSSIHLTLWSNILFCHLRNILRTKYCIISLNIMWYYDVI